jgi:endonuclease/exonuclease/phosphatase family metal-dependent hydrolase
LWISENDTGFELHNAHVPDAATVGGAIKLRTYEAIRRRVEQESGRPRILCGDLNCLLADEEYPPGLTPRPRRRGWKARWDEAEFSVTENPSMFDVFTSLNASGRKRPPASYYLGPKMRPVRFDHVFSSEHLVAKRYRCWTEWLDRGLSDHAAIEVELHGRP